MFRSRLKFSVHPTRKGRNEIDENHPLWNKHYIKDKLAAWLEKDEYLQYIKVHILQINNLVENCDGDSILWYQNGFINKPVDLGKTKIDALIRKWKRILY